MSENKYIKRRLKLKYNLYKLLKEEPNGIIKAHLWNIYSVKVKRISADYFGAKKMHNLLGEFDDMIYEDMVRGRPTIRLVKGYRPEEEEDEEEEEQMEKKGASSVVQIYKVSSSGSEESLAETKKKTPGQRAEGRSEEEGRRRQESSKEELLYQRMETSRNTQVQFMGPPLFAHSIQGPRPAAMSAAPMMPSHLMQGAISRPTHSTLQGDISQAVSQFLEQARKASSTAPSGGANPDNPCVVSSSSETDSESEEEEIRPRRRADERSIKIEAARQKLKQNLVKLLSCQPKGIKKTEIWGYYNQKYHKQPNKAEVGVTQLTKVLNLFDDVIEEFQNEHGIPYLRLIRQAGGNQWASQSLGRATPVIDLTKDEQSSRSTRMLGQLTQDQGPSGFIPLTSGLPVHPRPANPGDFQILPAPSSSYTMMKSNDDSLKVGQLVIHPVSLRKFERKETHLPKVWNQNRGGWFPETQIEQVAKECIEALAEADEHVSLERVEALMLQRFGKRNLSEVGKWRYANQIPCLSQHNRMLCKVNAYIQAFLNTRSICTLHELKLCMAEFGPDKDRFEALQVGPLQRLPIIYNHFKFPDDMADIPEITTSDIFENLRNYLTKYKKWGDKLEMEAFMEYLVETYKVENAYLLGVRIRSLPLVIQVLKKSQRDAGMSRRKVTDDTKEALKQEIEQAFNRFKAAILSKRGDGQNQIREYYMQMNPSKALMDIFDKYGLLCESVEAPATKQERRNFARFREVINNFLQAVTSDSFGRNLFHIALCISKTEVEAIYRQFLTEATKPKEVQVTVKKKPPPPKDSVVRLLKTYLEKCQNHGALTLKSLDHIEDRIVEHFDFDSFIAMGFGRFLEFLLKEAKQELDDSGGTSLGSGGGHGEVAGGFLPTLTHTLEFIHQCRQCNISKEEQIQQALCHQFSVKEVKQLGHGTTSRLLGLTDRPGRHVSNQHCVVYEAAVLPPEGFELKGQTGILGHQTRESALACLENCPLLENMADWSQWSLVFEPQLGKLRDFVQKYGGCQNWPLEGNRILRTDFVALESSPGQFLRLTSSSTPEKFQLALRHRNSREVSGLLMSMVVGNKGVEGTPTALLANQIKEELFMLHGETSADNVPGAPSSFQHGQAAVKFVLDCLLVLPVKTCSVLASQMFLEPLGQVIGQSKSKNLLLQACGRVSEVSHLQRLGCLLGVAEWTDSIQGRCQPTPMSLEEVAPEYAEEFFRDDPEPIDDSEEEDVDDLSSYLSDVEVETEVKGQVKEEEEEVIDVDDGMEMDDEDTKQDTLKTETTTCIDLTLKSEDSVVDLVSLDNNSDSLKDTMETDTTENACQRIVNQIRREEFGIGVELNEDGQRLMKVQQERLGRSLDRLSKDLYSKDTHFVLELIQNADDNSYPDNLAEGECPSVKFLMRPDGVIVLNNECGFRDKDIKALCDVGRSTKGKHKAGYIGQKGIGFKSVFRVTDEPEIHSNGFHIKFDVNSGPTGYILPHWVEEDRWKEGQGWTTKIVLPLKESMKSQTTTLAARFNDIHPSLLLFLNRLRQITIDSRVEDSVQNISRKDYGENLVEIAHGDKMDRWLVVKKSLDASKISLQAKSGVEVESTEIALAFPLRPGGQKKDSKFVPSKQPVFAFLPLRSYGFRFIIQGDFDVPSSREDVDRDSSWNQWLRNEIHILFLEALDVFKAHSDFSNMEAVISYLQFVPVEDEIIDFFRPVANQILQKLRAKPCVPTQPNSKGQCSWKIPSQMVRVKDPLVLEVVTPDLLKDTLNLYYLHRDVAAMLNSTLTSSLGIESLNTEHLLQVGKSLSQKWNANKERAEKDEDILMTAKWLACVHRSLDEFLDNQPVYDRLKAMKIIPLATYRRESTSDSTIFFPLSENAQLSYNDPLTVLQRDLNTIHPLLVSSPDSEVNSQVQKLLVKIGVCQLSPREVICHHIVPILKSDQCKGKREDILISYIVYIKEQTEHDPSLVNLEELGRSAILKTNKGMRNPSEVPIHFTPEYKNGINLQGVLPGYDWVLLDPVYIQNKRNPVEIQKWRQFFIKLGLTDFISVRQINVKISADNIASTPWGPLRDILGTIPEGTYIKDWSSSELEGLIKDNRHPSSYPQQMSTLCVLLAEEWDKTFSRYTSTYLCNASGTQVREVETSFSILLKTASWLPGLQTCVAVENGEICVTDKVLMMQPSCLYARLREIENLLTHTVIYVNVNIPARSSFGQFLGIKYSVDLQELKKFLIEWGNRGSESEPKVFITTKNHICGVYDWLKGNLPPVETQRLFHDHPVIFVPDEPMPVRVTSHDMFQRPPEGLVTGRMLSRNEVWWSDPTGLIVKYKDIVKDYHLEIAKKAILFDAYKQNLDLKVFFINAARITEEPSLSEYGELLVLMGQVLSLTDKDVVSDATMLYVTIGKKLQPNESVMSNQTRMNVLELQTKTLKSKLDGQKILATTSNKWVGLEDHPMLADNRELEKMFEKNDLVNFVVQEDRTPQPKRGGRTAVLDRNLLEKLMPFYQFCAVKKLSDCINIEAITEMFEPCPELQMYMHLAVPIVQRYLYKYNPDIYQELQNQNMSQRLAAMQFYKVRKLEVKYSLSHSPDVFVLRTEKCLQSDNVFYFHHDHTESYPDINREVARMFSNSDDMCSRDLRGFLNELTTVLTKEPHKLEETLEHMDCDQLPAEEPVWHVSAPVLQVQRSLEPEEEEEEEEEEYVEEEFEAGGQRREGRAEEEGGQSLRAWPPMSDSQGMAQNKGRERKEREERPESKIWPPPKAPDYMKKVKELPSQFKVTDDRAPPSGEEKPTKGDNSSREEDGSEHAQGAVIRRQDSEGKGTKRKISENETELGGENKRAVLDEKERESEQKSEAPQSTTAAVAARDNEKDGVKVSGGRPRGSSGATEDKGHHQDNRENSNERDSVGQKPGGKRRHPTDSSQGSPRVPNSKRILMDHPAWTDLASDYTYEELCQGSNLKNPPEIQLDMEQDEAGLQEIGRWGEHMVYQYLLQQKDVDPDIVEVKWCNAENEIGFPYDMELSRKTDSGIMKTFIEVKTTLTDDKDVFEISSQQIQFAKEHRENFHIYRVFNAGDQERVRLVRINNLSLRMDQKQVRLWMMI